MRYATVGRVLAGLERTHSIEEHLAWLENRNDHVHKRDFSEAPIAKFVEERVEARWKK